MTQYQPVRQNDNNDDLENNGAIPDPAVTSSGRTRPGRNNTGRNNRRLILSVVLLAIVVLSAIAAHTEDQVMEGEAYNGGAGSAVTPSGSWNLWMSALSLLAIPARLLYYIPQRLFQPAPDINAPLPVTEAPWFPTDFPAEVHDQPLQPLGDVACRAKVTGHAKGKICDFEGDTYYLKAMHQYVAHEESKNDAGEMLVEETIISFEEFNRQLARNVIAIRAPSTRFFVEKNDAGRNDIYIGSRKLDNLQFADGITPITNEQLGDRGVAKLLVSKTFFYDLYRDNWAYDDKGVVLIDIDSANQVPLSLDDYLDKAIRVLRKTATPRENVAESKDIHEHIAVSINDIREMKNVYEQMRHTPLPHYHNEFNLSDDTYAALLDIYTHVCERTIQEIEASSPDVPASQANNEIYTHLIQHLTEAKEALNQPEAMHFNKP